MLTLDERAAALGLAEQMKTDHRPYLSGQLIAYALVESEKREAAYQVRIAELTADVERITASGVANAKRYAADLAAEKRAGAERVERIRLEILAGATDEAQSRAALCSLRIIADELSPSRIPSLYGVCQAYLAQGQALAEARALLSEIGERALRLLGKGA